MSGNALRRGGVHGLKCQTVSTNTLWGWGVGDVCWFVGKETFVMSGDLGSRWKYVELVTRCVYTGDV